MKHIPTFLTGLVLLSAIFGGNYINHGAHRALDAEKPVEVRTLHTLLSDKPLTRDTYILKVNPNQKDLVHVDPNTITNRFTITLFKNGKEQKKALQIQVYGMSNRYELNAYIG